MRELILRRAWRGFCVAAVLIGVGVALVLSATGREPVAAEWLAVVGGVVALAGVAVFDRVMVVHGRAMRRVRRLPPEEPGEQVWGIRL